MAPDGRSWGRAAGEGTRQVYDVADNVAKRETHEGRELLVHRKGATRAFPAGSAELPEPYRAVGQPVFIPGSMGTCSYVLAGEAGSMGRAFGSACHGAGRALSRTAARKRISGADLRRELEARGIVVRSPSNKGLAEEAPFAYKDVDRVVEVVARAGLARPVARLTPLGVVKPYAWEAEEGSWAALSLDVLTLEGTRVKAVTASVTPTTRGHERERFATEVFERFGIPQRLD